MKVELTNDAVDELMRSILIQDYKGLCSDIDNLESAKELAPHRQQDLEHNREYKAAMEKLMEYYIGFDWQREI